jgi:hypothetical protein
VGEFERDLLGEELGALVITDHVFERNRLVFVADAAVGDTDAANGTSVDNALNSGGLGGTEKVAGAIDIRAVELGGVLGPKAIVGSDVEEQAASGDSTVERGRVAEVARDGFKVDALDKAAWADERSDVVATFHEEAGYVPSEESRGAGD